MKKRKRKKEKSKKGNEVRKSLWRIWIVETVVPAAVLALFITTFIGQLYKIPSGSMRPTLQERDRILVCKFIYGLRIPFRGRWLLQRRPPKKGDVIVFLYDKEGFEHRKNYIKRVAAVGDETLEVKGGKVYINDEIIAPSAAFPEDRIYYNRKEESWRSVKGQRLPMSYRSGKIKVPDGDLFVLGDNSLSSKDSRWWGFVPLRKVRGKAILIVWPPGRIGLIR